MVNSVMNLFLLAMSEKCRKGFLQGWKRNPWRGGAEVGLGGGVVFLLVGALVAGGS